MRLSCPCCAAEMTLDVLFTHEHIRRSVARLAQQSLPFGALTLKYMALFKPASRALSIDRMVRLVDELLPDIERRAVTRNGRDWEAGAETWRAAMGVVLGMRDAGSLRLPLADHGLLYQVIANMGDKAERAAETAREAARRTGRPTATGDGPRDLGGIAADLVASPVPPTAPEQPGRPDYSKPSRAAQETRARIAAAQRARELGAEPSQQQSEGTTP